MSGKILCRGVLAGDCHPLVSSASDRSRPPSTSADEILDPRIQVELEKLNKASEDINRLELQLNEARAKFRQVLTESTQMLNIQAKKLGACIEKARPYYEARIQAKQAQAATQNAALRYERAHGQLAAAKEMVYLAEEGFFKKGQPFDPAWQEMLNHATIKVNDAEKERYESQLEHQRTAQLFAECEQTVKRLQKELRRHIAKSRPYFEMKAKFNQQMEDQKKYVSQLEAEVLAIKHHYATTLSNLEQISDEIHRQRRNAHASRELGTRGVGVGAESPVPLTDNTINNDVSEKLSKNKENLKADSWSEFGKKSRTSADVANDSMKAKDSSNGGTDDSVCSSGDKNDGNGGDKNEEGAILTSHVILRRSKQVVKPQQHPVSTHPVPTNPASIVPASSVPASAIPESTVAPSTVAASAVPASAHPASAHPPSDLPTVQVTSASAPTSPTKPDPAQDLGNKNVRTNAELMASIQRNKSKPVILKTSRTSRDDLLECHSDTESLSGSIASASMLDDDQIQSLMLEMGEYTKFIEEMDEKEAKSWKRLSLPAKLTQLEKNFNLEEFLAEARIIEEPDIVFAEKLAPMAQEEDDFSYEIIENEDDNENC